MPSSATLARRHPETITFRERRLTVRYPCELDGKWKSLAPGDHDTYPIRLRFSSPDGVSLHAPRRFDIGTLLDLEFLDRHGRLVRKLARVMHVRPDGDHGYYHGCMFIMPLGPEELGDLA
jgi:hypothetical protein